MTFFEENIEMNSSLTLKLDAVQLTDEQFYQLCQNNETLQF